MEPAWEKWGEKNQETHQESQCPAWDLNCVPSKYKSEVLPLYLSYVDNKCVNNTIPSINYSYSKLWTYILNKQDPLIFGWPCIIV